ncbi:MAG: 23S rRNA (adenine(2503)-C(2))-methyltransferase RlmN [bacterium]
MEKTNLIGLSRKELAVFIQEISEKKFRVSQIWSWIYQKKVKNFQEMTNISKNLRTTLTKISCLKSLKLEKKKISPKSGTRKYLWKLEDGNRIESVFIPEGKRKTICLSSQVGCSLGCKFCATADLGFIRNLDSCEIVSQVLDIIQDTGITPTNLVVMGMGEPFLNYDNLIKALAISHDPEGLALSHRKITVSTAGLVPEIYRYTKEKNPYKLAISLNAADNALRSEIMPINRKYPLPQLIKAAKEYTQKSGKRITFEYVLLKGINDSPQNAEKVLQLLRGIKCKLNLIVYNNTKGDFSPPSKKRVQQFLEIVRKLAVPVMLRNSKGDDIEGACGQLTGK